MIRIVGACRQVRIVSENLADRENSRRRAAISLLFSKTRLVLASESRAPGDAVFSKQHRKGSSHSSPLSAGRSLEQSQLAAHGVPCRRNCEDQLLAIIGNALRVGIDH